MSLRTLLLLIFALVVSAGTAFFAKSYLASLTPAAQVVEAPSKPAVQVLVARRDMIAGTFLGQDNTQWKAWPEDSVDPEMLTDKDVSIADIEGSVIRQAASKGQPLLRRLVIDPQERGFLAAVLTPGMRAISVPVENFTAVSGFIFPGDSVDVIARFSIRSERRYGESSGARYSAVTALEGVRVLAMDQKTENLENEVKVAETATLEVTPKEAEKIALILEWGTFTLALNSLSDSQAVLDQAEDWWRRRGRDRRTALDPSHDAIPGDQMVRTLPIAFAQSPALAPTPETPWAASEEWVEETGDGPAAPDSAVTPVASSVDYPISPGNVQTMDLSVSHDVDRNYTMDWELFTINGVDMVKVQNYLARNTRQAKPVYILRGSRATRRSF
jgi:pilus assembly protein CpaB